jgi:hypothetical protein
MSGASPVLPGPLLFVATVAKGGGDLSAAGNWMTELKAYCHSLLLVVVAQSGVDPTQALTRILGSVGDEVKSIVVATKCLRRGSATEPSSWLLAEGLEAIEPPSPVAIVQGPLLCFMSSEDALRACYSRIFDPLPLMITIREFGQGSFCLPCPTAQGPQTFRDLSAGLMPGELGIFDLRDKMVGIKPGTVKLSDGAILPSLDLPYFFGYFRTTSHSVALGRMIGMRALDQMRAISQSQSETFAVSCCLPFDEASLRALKEGLNSALQIEGFASTAIVAKESDLNFVLGDGGDSGLSLPVAAVLQIRSTGGPAEAVAISLLIADTAALDISMTAFRSLLKGAEGAIVTGDSSFNEVVAVTGPSHAAAVPFWYSCEPHKRDVDAGLRRTVNKMLENEKTRAAAKAVSAFWAFCEGGDGRSLGSALEALNQAVAEVGKEESCGSSRSLLTTWPCLRQAFSIVCNALMDEHGRLVDNVLGMLTEC